MKKKDYIKEIREAEKKLQELLKQKDRITRRNAAS